MTAKTKSQPKQLKKPFAPEPTAPTLPSSNIAPKEAPDEILSDEEFDAVPRSHRSSPYPWDRWMDGQARRIRRGVHFTCSVKSLVVSIRREAGSRNMSCTLTSEGEDAIVFKCTPRTEG